MRFRHGRLVLAIALLSSGSAAHAQETAPPGQAQRPSFWQAAAGVVAVNWVTWAHNWYVQRWEWANVGLRSWGANLRHGFVFDNDGFLDDQLAHPYHGSFYHNSARASGYGFWGSVPFVAAGSVTWELFGETIAPSINDLIYTTMGGVALGEVMYRASNLLSAPRESGGHRLGREAAAFVVSPMAQAQGLLSRGEESIGTGAVPSGSAVVAAGRRADRAFLELTLRYGDPFRAGPMGAYDAFDFRVQVSPDASFFVHHVNISGLLARRSLTGSARSQLLLGLFHHYDYDELVGMQAGGNSLSAALLYQRRLGSRTQLNLSTHAEGIVLGGISSDQGFYWRRDFDLGPGLGTRIGASLARDGHEWLRLDGRAWWLHSLHGSRGNHIATSLRLGAMLPLVGGMGVGGDMTVTARHSSYPDGQSVHRRVPHLRAYLTWAPR